MSSLRTRAPFGLTIYQALTRIISRPSVPFGQGELVRVYDFPFGFVIPGSTNSWEAIYDVPSYTKEQIDEYVSMLQGNMPRA